jgi:signal transduction histidine kinase
MNEGVVIIDTSRRYKINIAGMRILAREPEEFRDGAEAVIEDIGLTGNDGLPIPVQNSPFWHALAGQQSIANEQFKMRCRNGEERVVAVSAAPLKTEEGELDGAVAVFRDITEEVQSHEELVAAYARLREHDRLKSAFVSNVTHELRTPLNVILGLCQLLIRDSRMPLTVLQEDAVTRMERNARSLLELVNDLIDYSRLEAGRAALRLKWVDINELVDEVVNGFAKVAAEKGVKLEYEVAPTCQQVMTDSHKLHRVLSNLVSNAVKFTSVGSVSICASSIDDEYWSIEVRDTGIGISADALKYIFDEFRQVDDRLTRSYSGTGIGLAITRKITDLLEGKIEVRSTPGGGSVFKITLPRVIRQRTGTGSLTDARVLQIKDAKSLRSKAS